MSYVNDNLMPNEKVQYTASVHPAIFLPSIISFLITLAFFIYGLSNMGTVNQIGSPSTQINPISTIMLCVTIFLFPYTILVFLQALIVISTTEFAVTNRRVIAKTGFIRRHTLEMLLSKIESVSVRQGILGRMINFGTVTVIGTGGTRESFSAIIDPIGVRKNINQIIEGYLQYQQKLSSLQASG
jgi:uncharacterized membrane protein YdbT with pleckstrin-like domain